MVYNQFPMKHFQIERLFSKAKAWAQRDRLFGVDTVSPERAHKSSIPCGCGPFRRFKVRGVGHTWDSITDSWTAILILCESISNRRRRGAHCGMIFEFDRLGEFVHVFEMASHYESGTRWGSLDGRTKKSSCQYSIKIKVTTIKTQGVSK
jgi:hypothetical protein